MGLGKVVVCCHHRVRNRISIGLKNRMYYFRQVSRIHKKHSEHGHIDQDLQDDQINDITSLTRLNMVLSNFEMFSYWP